MGQKSKHGYKGEACLPSSAYFPWTPNYTKFMLDNTS